MKKLLLSVVLFLLTIPSDGQRRGSVVNIDGSISVARVNDYMEYCHHSQDKDNWCWAACVQMVLDYYGISVSQYSIVQRTYGTDEDFTANQEDIILALDGWTVDDTTIKTDDEHYKSAKTLIDAVATGRPLIIGMDEDSSSTGHAYVLTHIFFKRDSYGNMTPTRVVVLNPAKTGDLEESLDWTDFYDRINTIITLKTD